MASRGRRCTRSYLSRCRTRRSALQALTLALAPSLICRPLTLPLLLLLSFTPRQDRKREKYLCACVYRSDVSEVLFAQRYARRVPTQSPRTYFADRSEASTNFILISERLAYASETEHPRGVPACLPAFALQRAHSKFHDHHLGTPPAEYYHVLVTKLGQLAGWYKENAERAAELNDAFPTVYADQNPMVTAGPLATRQFDALLDFLRLSVAQLLPADATSDAAISQMRLQFAHLTSTLYSKLQVRGDTSHTHGCAPLTHIP